MSVSWQLDVSYHWGLRASNLCLSMEDGILV